MDAEESSRVWPPKEPVHSYEHDIARDVLAEDPWDAIFCEADQFADPEEIAELRKDYEVNLAAREERKSSTGHLTCDSVRVQNSCGSACTG